MTANGVGKLLFWSMVFTGLALGSAQAANGFAQFGEPKYPPDFQHFDYVNPDAPKGGTLALSLVSTNASFDKFNPFTLKGVVAPGLLDLVFETLTINSLDEPNTQYGLLADDIQLAPDASAVTFHLNPLAHFSNGDPVTAAEVKYSFEILRGNKSSPNFKAYFSEIDKVSVVDPQAIRFDFKRPGRDLAFVAGSLPVFSPKWTIGATGEKISFDQLRLEKPVASGPYIIDKVAQGESLTYRRNPDYWGRDIPVRRGSFNFDHVVYKLYKDRATQVSAIRALDYDFYPEDQMRFWCCQYIGKHFDDGSLVKEIQLQHNLIPFNGYAFNLRVERFKDPRVRRALGYIYDWDWVNDKILGSEFDRVESYFSNSPLAAEGLPSEAELKLLEPYRDQLDPAVFGPMVHQPTTHGPGGLRDNFTKALELFAQAGWHYRDGALRNDRGEPFTLKVQGGAASGPGVEPYYLNLRKLGIQVERHGAEATSDRAKTRRFDFEFTSVSFRKARDPAPELWRNLNSADADVPGSDNVAGVKSPVVDALLRKLLDAQTAEEQTTAAHALDRVLIHGYYLLPWRYLKHSYLIHNARLVHPATLPLYFGPYEWLFAAWWDHGAAK